MPQTLHFISGLPRSGSTLLAAILRQNPRFHAAMSSPVGGLFSALLNRMSSRNEGHLFVSPQQREDLLKGVFHNYYQSLTDTPVVFDTNRGWCARLPALATLYPESKVICCVRDVAWVMNSFEKAFRNNPLQANKMFNNETESNTVYSRIDTLGQRDRTVGFAWSALKEAYYSEHASSLLLVDYDLLISDPAKTLELIYQFLGETPFQHDFETISYSEPRFDENLGIPGLHDIEGPIKRRTSRCILPPDLFEKYQNMTFWTDPDGSEAHVIRAKPGTLQQ